MTRQTFAAAMILILAVCDCVPAAEHAPASSRVNTPMFRVEHVPMAQHAYFQANRGQCPPDVEYSCRKEGTILYLHGGALEVAYSANRATDFTISPIGGAAKPHSTGGGAQAGTNSYFGITGAKDIAGVPGYAKVRYAGVYPGIDLTYGQRGGGVVSQFALAPGANPGAVRLHVGGVHLALDGGGNAACQDGSARMLRRPAAYQILGGKKKVVSCAYRPLSGSDLGFTIGEYDHSKPILIDSFLWFGVPDTVDPYTDIATDRHCNLYIVGHESVPLMTAKGMAAVSVATVDEYSPAGTLIFETLIGGVSATLGGGGAHNSRSLAVDAAGNVCLAVDANVDFQCTRNAFCRSVDADRRAPAIIEVAADGSRIVYSSFLGDYDAADAITQIATGPKGNIYVVGSTGAPDLPTTSGALARTMPQENNASYAYLMIFDPAKSGLRGLLYSSYISGTSGLNATNGLAVDRSGCAYICGSESGGDFPTTENAVTPRRGEGGGRAWLVKVDPTLRGKASLVYGTYVEGTSLPDSEGWGVAADDAGCAYLVGYSLGPVPTTQRSVQPGFGGGHVDSWIVKFNPAGTRMIWATLLGGSDIDYLRNIALDSSKNVYVAGYTRSRNYPITKDALPNSTRPGQDAGVVSVISADGKHLLFSSYIPDSGPDFGASIALDRTGGIFEAGRYQQPFLLKLSRASR